MFSFFFVYIILNSKRKTLYIFKDKIKNYIELKKHIMFLHKLYTSFMKDKRISSLYL